MLISIVSQVTQASRVRSFVIAAGLTYGSLILGSLVIFLAVVVLAPFGIDPEARPAIRLLMSTVLLQGVTFGGLSVVYLELRDLDFDFVPVDVPNKRDLAVILLGIPLVLGLLVSVSVIIATLGLETAENQVIGVAEQNPVAFLLLVPLSFLLVGPGEELLYRGLVQGTLREALHPAIAVVIASGLFASIHLFSLTGSGKWVYVGVVFVIALVFGATYEYTDNLLVPAVIHGAYNAAQFAAAYVAATGGAA
jgi:membrane protease YdiL (CAAX protease family)